MATTTVYRSSQGRVFRSSGGTPQTSWTNVRGTNTTNGTATGTSTSTWFGASQEAARGGQVLSSNARAYFYFDLSSIGTTISSITLKVQGASNSALTNGDWVVARANQDNDFGTIATSDYALVFNSSTSFTGYSLSVSSWSANSNNQVSLNSTAISNANSGGELCVCVMNFTYDYSNLDVEENFGDLRNTINFATSGTTRANLVVVHADGATGYPNDVNLISSANINQINAISTINIDEVNGVS